MTVENIKNHIKKKLEEIAKCHIYFQKKGDKSTSDEYLGMEIALQSLLDKIENNEIEE